MDFVRLSDRGRNEAWRYLVAIATILFFWLVLGSIPFLLAVVWVSVDSSPATGVDMETGMITGVDPVLGNYIPLNLSFIALIAGLVLAVVLVHRRGLRTLVTPARRIDWRRIGQGFGLWLLLAALMTLIETLVWPDAFAWAGVPVGRYLIFLALALVLTPIQTTTEELLFRGYLLQTTGRLTRRPWLLALVNGALFLLPHLSNPELKFGPIPMVLYYAGMGVFFAWVVLRDKRAELVIGAHAANNLFVALLINFEGSALQTPALVVTTHVDALYNLVTFLISAAVFYVVLLGRRDPRLDAQAGTSEIEPVAQ